MPGIGTIEDLKKAHALGVRSVRIATHSTEADVSKQHIEAAKKCKDSGNYNKKVNVIKNF